MFDTSRPLAKATTFDIYVVAASKAAGTKELIHPETDQPVFLTTPAIITAAEVATVQSANDGNGTAKLHVNLTPMGGKAMTAATANLAGSKLALVIDGKLFSAVTISSPLGQEFEITHGMSADENEKFFRSLTGE